MCAVVCCDFLVEVELSLRTCMAFLENCYRCIVTVILPSVKYFLPTPRGLHTMRFQWQGLRGCGGSARELLLAYRHVREDADILSAMPASVYQQQLKKRKHKGIKRPSCVGQEQRDGNIYKNIHSGMVRVARCFGFRSP